MLKKEEEMKELESEISCFLRREELSTRVLESIFNVVKEDKAYIDFDDFKLFQKFFIDDCGLETLTDDMIKKTERK